MIANHIICDVIKYKAHAQYYIAICGLFRSTIFSHIIS